MSVIEQAVAALEEALAEVKMAKHERHRVSRGYSLNKAQEFLDEAIAALKQEARGDDQLADDLEDAGNCVSIPSVASTIHKGAARLRELTLTAPDERTLPVLPEGILLHGIDGRHDVEGKLKGYFCRLWRRPNSWGLNGGWFEGEGPTPRAAVLAAIAKIKDPT